MVVTRSMTRANEEIRFRINVGQPVHEREIIMPTVPILDEGKFLRFNFFLCIANFFAFHITVADESMNEEEQPDEEMQTPSRLTRIKNAVNRLINGVHGALNLFGE